MGGGGVKGESTMMNRASVQVFFSKPATFCGTIQSCLFSPCSDTAGIGFDRLVLRMCSPVRKNLPKSNTMINQNE